jgi:uncharacterized protein YabE (DUF348 family)
VTGIGIIIHSYMTPKLKYRYLAILITSMILLSLALGLGLRKTVTLSVDGVSHVITTYTFKVADLLRLEHFYLSPLDKLTPSQDTWLKKGETISLVHAIPIQILVDGVVSTIYSAERTPSSLLTQAGVHTLPGDLLLSNGLPVEAGQSLPLNSSSFSIQVVRSVSFTLTVDGKSQTLTSSAPTLGSALWAAGYMLFEADKLVPPADTPLAQGLAANLTPSHPVTIQTQSGSILIRTAACSVGEALESAHLTPQGLDYSLPAPNEPIPANNKIRLVRVTEQVLVEQSPLSFETKYQPVSDLDLDSQSILQTGEYGLTARRVRVRYEDGQEVSRKVDNEWVARQPRPRIIGYGTRVVMHTTTVDGVTIQYWRTLTMYATSYHPSEGGDTTASGLHLQKGVAAVDTSIVPFFTQLYVPGYGDVTAADVGGGVIGRWIDLGYSDSDYIPWHQWVTVYFLWPPPDNIVWIVP